MASDKNATKNKDPKQATTQPPTDVAYYARAMRDVQRKALRAVVCLVLLIGAFGLNSDVPDSEVGTQAFKTMIINLGLLTASAYVEMGSVLGALVHSMTAYYTITQPQLPYNELGELGSLFLLSVLLTRDVMRVNMASTYISFMVLNGLAQREQDAQA